MPKDEEKNKDEEEIKSFCQKDTIKNAAKVSKFLRTVALDDKYMDRKAIRVKVWDDKETKEFHYEYEIQDFPVSAAVRVTAAKTWKEMSMDKAIGDVKEKAKASKVEGLDMKKALEAIGKSKAAEKTAGEEPL